MSILRNQTGAIVPVREQRKYPTTVMAALNAEIVMDVNGDESALIYVNGGASTLTCTFLFEGTVDSVNYFPILVVPYFASGSAGSPSLGAALITEAITATAVQRVYALRCAQLTKFRIRMSAYTTGSADITITTDAQKSLHPAVFDGRPTSLMLSTTAATGVAATATIPSVAGLRHYIDFIRVIRSATAVLTASATPTVVTTTNLPGSPAFTFGQSADNIGVDVERALDFGGTGLAASAVGTNTTIVAPATTGVIWRINVGYRLGL